MGTSKGRLAALGLALLISGPISATDHDGVDVKQLLQQCLPSAPSHLNNSYLQAKVEVSVNSRDTPEENFSFIRLEKEKQLWLKPVTNNQGYLQTEDSVWLYEADKHTLSTLKQPTSNPVYSELLIQLIWDSSSTYALSGHNSFGGQHYYTLNIRGNGLYPNRSLSLKDDGEVCRPVRAAFFDTNNKVVKKFYLQWQVFEDGFLLSQARIEDTSTLTLVKYSIEAIERKVSLTEVFPKPPTTP